MNQRKRSYITLRDYIAITFGALIMAAGIAIFLVDAKVVPGGVSGLAMTAHYLSDSRLPVGLMIWIFNIPLYIWGLKVLGSRFGWRTFYAFTLNSFFIDLLRGQIPGLGFIQLNTMPAVQNMMRHDFLLAVLCGSILLGLGLGLIFKFKGTTGGSDIVAAIMQDKLGWKPGQAIMFIDFFVITLAGFAIHWKALAVTKPAFTLTIYAFILLFVSSKLIDVLIEGFDYARSAIIISWKNDEIADAIKDELSRGATIVSGQGLYTNRERKIIYTVITRKEEGILLDIVKDIDPHAFMIVNNVHEVLGAGFRRRI